MVQEDTLLFEDELQDDDYFPSLPFAAMFSCFKAIGLKVTCLLCYCSEGDNMPDSFQLAEAANKDIQGALMLYVYMHQWFMIIKIVLLNKITSNLLRNKSCDVLDINTRNTFSDANFKFMIINITSINEWKRDIKIRLCTRRKTIQTVELSRRYAYMDNVIRDNGGGRRPEEDKNQKKC
ncbi:hypothetical protein AgCh_023598 [Apium graveolens]